MQMPLQSHCEDIVLRLHHTTCPLPCPPNLLRRLRNKIREAILERLGMLIRSMFRQTIHQTHQHHSNHPILLLALFEGNLRRRTSRLQERRFAHVALDILGLLVDLQLRLGDSLVIFVLARTL